MRKYPASIVDGRGTVEVRHDGLKPSSLCMSRDL